MFILDQLWYGKSMPWEQIHSQKNEYKALLEKLDEYEEIIKSELSADGKAAFDKYIDTEIQTSGLLECNSFVSGFRTGVLIMLDVFAEKGIEKA